MFNYEPTVDLTGKVAIVTGGSSGIGRITCLKLAALNCHIILAGRNPEKSNAVIENIIETTGNKNVEFLELHLDRLQSCKEAAQQFIAKKLPLHILINNAGYAGPAGMTDDGFQYTFQTNHLGHFLFTQLLLPCLKASAPSRIINVSSESSLRGRLYDFNKLRDPNWTIIGINDYEDSKLANVMYAKKLSELLDGTGVTTYSLHPGQVATDIWRPIPWPIASIMKMFMITEEQGAMMTLFCAVDPTVEKESGLYYSDGAVHPGNALATDSDNVNKLFDYSVDFVKEFM